MQLHENMHTVREQLAEEGILNRSEGSYEALDISPDSQFAKKNEHLEAVYALHEDIADSLNQGDEFSELGQLSRLMSDLKSDA